jgi:hypothetical protein
MPTEELKLQQVASFFTQAIEQLQQLAISCQQKPEMQTARVSSSVRDLYQDSEFLARLALSIYDPNDNLVVWEATCKFDTAWKIELGIFIRKHDRSEFEKTVSFPNKEVVGSGSELTKTLDTVVADIKTSIESRDISSWIELSKT